MSKQSMVQIVLLGGSIVPFMSYMRWNNCAFEGNFNNGLCILIYQRYAMATVQVLPADQLPMDIIIVVPLTPRRSCEVSGLNFCSSGHFHGRPDSRQAAVQTTSADAPVCCSGSGVQVCHCHLIVTRHAAFFCCGLRSRVQRLQLFLFL